jgi:acetate kinase
MPELSVIASGLIEEIGDEQSPARLTWQTAAGDPQKISKTLQITEHRQAVTAMTELLRESGTINDVDDLAAIGHRVVHGGEEFHEPILIDETAIQTIAKLIPLAPLHNPANLTGIKVTRELAPDTPQIAVFDTAVHQSIPE